MYWKIIDTFQLFENKINILILLFIILFVHCRCFSVIIMILFLEPECIVVKDLCLQFLLTIVTGTDNLNENPALRHLMTNSVFEPLTEVYIYIII